ncbi:undecaprenyl-phosphate galactose phosphotransferase WbaP [Enterobacter mori]|jgi:Undecaprenyl-phosphate galactose phosphotransferase, WbaP/exopolysaccharide biosynthesis polyprenyl glycosylphosphotransferase|uniref:undecaprenyl-phosphate galactose phosphotransferase WbaP n=1 Tax=Enterobacter TaxID=547 RepID=UPI00157739D3|nr:undecaprenyl-phosphate galactose phosphotransferase WbaP [Enterobacter sp. JMULE2]EKX7629009.1 undecaprenyl-phosphate galactose phosphotransferase WbaP [Enterobacter mori]EME8861046.1 undecaprenyl-phosphate galactose phosphotransferase WbaP [Enterobacter mori]NTZ37558.1 undecaprenyl-phosphate galactose phosphotransferase WbaP [Enterobacter sp. JMULE2]
MTSSRTFFYTKCTVALVDFIAVTLPFFIALGLLDLFTGNLPRFIPQSEFDDRVITHVSLGIICIGWFWTRLRHYSYRKPFWFEMKELLRTLVIFAIIELSVIAFSKWQSSRYLWVLTWTFAMIMVPVGRALSRRLLNRLGCWKKTTVIIGTGKNASDACLALRSEESLGFDVKYMFGANPGYADKTKDIIYLNDEDWLLSHFDEKVVQFVIAVESDESDVREYWLKTLSKNGFRHVSVIPTTRGLPLYGTDMAFLFSHELMIFRVNNNLAKRTSRFVKRTFDIICSILIILVSSPLLAFLYYKVTRDGGPAIYGHMRVGRHGKLFPCYKFRSMVLNSQEVLQQLLDSDPEARAEWERDFKLKNDPRITPVGRFIRKTSLDELPQLFNVLRGQMSLVGPRPIISEELVRYDENVDYYLMAKPGMTGLWQVSGRNDVDYDTRVYFDSWYVKNWSLWNDIAILFKTVKVVLHRDGAY